MNIERLKTLRDVIATTPNENIDLSYFIKPHVCGTICCTLGWACEVPEFQAEGLRMGVDPEYTVLSPVYEGHVGFEAAVAFFELSGLHDAYRLFDAAAPHTGNNHKALALARLDYAIAHGSMNGYTNSEDWAVE